MLTTSYKKPSSQTVFLLLHDYKHDFFLKKINISSYYC